jgi:hypothetical protein
VIVRFDGETVRGAGQLSRLVAETPAGRPIAIEVTRGGATQKLTATLAEGGQGMRAWNFDMPDWEMSVPHPPAAPHPPLPPAAPHAPMAWSFRGDGGRDFAFNLLSGGPRKLGIEYMELGEQLASYFKLAGKSGVLVTSVDGTGPRRRRRAQRRDPEAAGDRSRTPTTCATPCPRPRAAASSGSPCSATGAPSS